jgi:hypothetical protein
VIDPGEVLDATLVVMQTVQSATELGTAPAGNPTQYGVLETGPGPLFDEGDQADRHRHLTLQIRLRSVVKASDRSVGERACLDQAHRFRAAVLDPTVDITGSGWVVRDRTHISTSGAISEGNATNVVDDIELWVVPAAVEDPPPDPEP